MDSLQKYYHQQIEELCQFLIPKDKKVLNLSNKIIGLFQKKRSSLKFKIADIQNLTSQEKFDYIILVDLIGQLSDIQTALENLHQVIDERSRIIITCYNYLWEPILKLAEKLALKEPQPDQNWLSGQDIENFLNLADMEVIKKGTRLLFPIKLPLISQLFNKYLARLPILKELCLIQYFIARKKYHHYSNKEYSVSVIIPTRNEAGNIENAILRIPKLGNQMEVIFVEGGSTDNTLAEIKRVIKKYHGRKDIKLVLQGRGIGKGDAVRKGFKKASHDILMILDADLTVIPEDLPKFYQAIRLQKGELVMGTRLVYPMEEQAMRFLNILGNKFFSLAFSFLLDQPIKDTLCGTKVMFRRDYLELAKNRSYFGDFDPYGDYDLIFGASKLNLKILEIPIRYRARTYGTSNIDRFRHGWLLLRMTWLAARKLKFI